MTATDKPLIWSGQHSFQVNGTDLHEDTLRIKSNYSLKQVTLKLSLPTLCITYADMAFQNAIGGEQKKFPASQDHGSHFSPAVLLTDPRDIEQFTYIRGASRVTIGEEATEIEFSSWEDLVIPRLRIDYDHVASVELAISDVEIEPDEPLRISVMQLADGRHVGGLRVEKRHPSWSPPVRKQLYDLGIQVIDGYSQKAVSQASVEIWHWDPELPTKFGTGGFQLDDRQVTDQTGWIQVSDRPSGELEAFVLRRPDTRAVVRCLRPLVGQRVRLQMRAWPLARTTRRYVWPKTASLEFISALCGMAPSEFLEFNRFSGDTILQEGMTVLLPHFRAQYQMEPWEDYDWIGREFGYLNSNGVAEANGLSYARALDSRAEIQLPGWSFFVAPAHSSLKPVDSMFDLPAGSTITVGRAYHPDPQIPYSGETIAVPEPWLAELIQRRNSSDDASKRR